MSEDPAGSTDGGSFSGLCKTCRSKQDRELESDLTLVVGGRRCDEWAFREPRMHSPGADSTAGAAAPSGVVDADGAGAHALLLSSTVMFQGCLAVVAPVIAVCAFPPVGLLPSASFVVDLLSSSTAVGDDTRNDKWVLTRQSFSLVRGCACLLSLDIY